MRKLKFNYSHITTTHTCAWHLEWVGVCAIESVATHAVDGALAGGSAVDGTLQTGLVSLGRLKKA